MAVPRLLYQHLVCIEYEFYSRCAGCHSPLHSLASHGYVAVSMETKHCILKECFSRQRCSRWRCNISPRGDAWVVMSGSKRLNDSRKSPKLTIFTRFLLLCASVSSQDCGRCSQTSSEHLRCKTQREAELCERDPNLLS